MKLFQRIITRRFSSYKKVQRPQGYKTITRPEGASVPLSKALEMRIKAAGPISVAEYMKLVSTNPTSGYYMKKAAIGQKGDFITSPEVSQLFGEMIAVWILNELSKIGNPQPLQLIELGPGKGTLMKDILQVFQHFKATENVSIHFVEISPKMASLQSSKLCDDCNFTIGGMYSPDTPHYKCLKTPDGIPVYWYTTVEKVPKAFSIVLAHEFFDALPCHKYQKIDGKWREVFIDVNPNEGDGPQFRYVASKEEAPLSKALIKKNETRDHVEISIEALSIAKHIACRIEEDGGFALIVDYGHTGEKSDTFRAFKNHQLHDPLVDPGSADLTTDVDFSLIREVIEDKLLTFGPVDQGDFLNRIGIQERLEILKENAPPEIVKQLEYGCHLITDKDKMGCKFKCFSAFPLVLKERLEEFPVAGFSDPKS